MPTLPLSSPPADRTDRSLLGLARAGTLTLFLLLPFTAQAQPDSGVESVVEPAGERAAEKRDAPANRLLLPHYVVDTTNPSGASTLWALRNETLVDLTVTIDYYEANSPQAPQQSTVIVIGGKEIATGNVRDVPNLEVDEDGFARGYVVFKASGNSGDLYGDYFIITSDQDFAEGSLLVDATSTVDSDLCNHFTLRFITGALFAGTTDVVVWVESDTAPLEPGTISYSLYDAGGQLVSTNTLFLDVVSTRFDIASLAPDNLTGGALEIQFAEGVRGHVALAMSAFQRYSVGFGAVCKG